MICVLSLERGGSVWGDQGEFGVVTGFLRDMGMRKFMLGLAPYPAVLGSQRRTVRGRSLL